MDPAVRTVRNGSVGAGRQRDWCHIRKLLCVRGSINDVRGYVHEVAGWQRKRIR